MIDYEHYEFDYDYDVQHGDRQARRKSREVPGYLPKLSRSEIVATVAERDDTFETGFDTTYQPSKYERGWLIDALGGFYTMGDISDVLRMIKGGKEACVYLCAANPNLGVEFVAAKVYRPRKFRNLRNDAQYRHGRTVLGADGKELHDDRALHAIAVGSQIGKQLQHESWMAHEFATLQVLSEAGADVPRPIASASNVILMSYIGDARNAAPTLNQVALPRARAARLFERIMRNVAIMLSTGRVHGDLSAYNVLHWEDEITLIDFPQVVNPHDNPSARGIFDRDVRRVCQYFRRYGVEVDPVRLSAELWDRYVPRDLWLELDPDFAAAAIEQDSEDR